MEQEYTGDTSPEEGEDAVPTEELPDEVRDGDASAGDDTTDGPEGEEAHQ